MASPQNIRHFSLDELKAIFLEMGEKTFRAKQVWEWIWKKSAASFADMTDLSKELRQKLGERFYPSGPAGNQHTAQCRWYHQDWFPHH